MAGISKADREARAFLKSLDTPPPLVGARKRLAAKTDKRYKPANLKVTAEHKKARAQVAKAKWRANQGVTIQLKAPHWINGIAYGPGTVTVESDLAKGLLEDERRVEYNNQRFEGSQSAFITPGVGSSGQYRATHVPATMFDSPMLSIAEAFTQT